MDFVDRIVWHDIWFTQRLLGRAGELPADTLDRPVLRGWESLSSDEAPTL